MKGSGEFRILTSRNTLYFIFTHVYIQADNDVYCMWYTHYDLQDAMKAELYSDF